MDDDKLLKKFIERRHPEYEGKIAHWKFLTSCYAGGRDWFADNIFQYLKEGEKEFGDRVDRAFRFNHSREVVDLVSKYLFKARVERAEANASDAVIEFWKHATLGGANIAQYARQISDKSSIYGRIWVVVDSSKSSESTSKADEKKDAGSIYSYIVSPQNALDMAFDERGELLWILIHEEVRDDEDPIASSGEIESRYRLWTREEWRLYKAEKEGRKTVVKEVESGIHDLGVVPVFSVDHITTDESPYSAPSLIGDIAYLDRAVANYLSNLDAIIQDQTFSQLAMPAQGVLPGDKEYDQLLTMGTKRVFLFDGEDGAKPFYLSPDPRQAELIIVAIKQIINEIYHSVGMAGERTKQDNAVGIDNSSGVAKAYDFERVNALLTSKAGALLNAENRLVELVNLWAGDENKTDEDIVEYPETFDTRGLYDEFEIASRLSLIGAPNIMRRQQMEQVVDKLFPKLAQDIKRKMLDELKEWPGDELLPISNASAIPGQDDDTLEDSAQENEQSN